jgi:hypothetical protein
MPDILILQLSPAFTILAMHIITNKGNTVDSFLMGFFINRDILGAATNKPKLAIFTSQNNFLHIPVIFPAFD